MEKLKILPWQDKKYWTNNNGEWNFMPPEHRPGGTRALHDDWSKPFNTIPRTWTSFIFVNWDYPPGDKTCSICTPPLDIFLWKGKLVPRSWQEQYNLITFKDIYDNVYQKIYQCYSISNGYYYRSGPRISEGWDGDKIVYCYVDYIPIPLIGNLLTTAIKKL